MKLNNNGFILTEVLLLSTVIISVLTFMYVQFKNINRSYQNSFNYDTVEGLYLANNIINYINEDNYDTLVEKTSASITGYIDITNCDIDLFETSSYCEQLFEKSGIEQIIFTDENLHKLKSNMSNINNDLKNYLKQIKTMNSTTDYRIIVKYNNGTFATMRFNKGNEYIQKGLIAYLDAINNSGTGHSNNTTLWKDLSGNNNDAILYNNPIWKDNSITFNGIDNYGRLENTAGMTYENGITLETRVKVVSLVQGTYQEFFGNWEDAGLGLTYLNSNRFASSIYTNSAWQEDLIDTNLSNLDEYYTLTTTYNNHEQKLYINGNLAKTINRGNSNIITQSLVPFAIGGNPNTTGMDTYINAEFQNVLIYNRALSENEIMRNYQADIARY